MIFVLLLLTCVCQGKVEICFEKVSFIIEQVTFIFFVYVGFQLQASVCAQNDGLPMTEDIRRILEQALQTPNYFKFGLLPVVFNVPFREISLARIHCVSIPFSMLYSCAVNITSFQFTFWRINMPTFDLKSTQQFRDVNITVAGSYEVHPGHVMFTLWPVGQNNGDANRAKGHYFWRCLTTRQKPRRKECAVELLQNALAEQLPRSCRITKIFPLN